MANKAELVALPDEASRRAVLGSGVVRHASWILGLVAAGAYLTMAPSVTGPRDGGGLTLALALAGVPHPTGYPLYVLLGHGFVTVLHRVGASWSYAANAWSGLGGAVAVALYASLALRVSSTRGAWRWAPALAAVALLAIHPAWVHVATLAEVYSWAFAWYAGAALWSLRALGGIESGEARGPGIAVGWGLLVGLGLAHHLTSVWLVLPLTIALAVSARRTAAWRPSWIAAMLGGAALPVMGYGWVAWRAIHPARFQWPLLEPSPGSFWEHITGRIYVSYLGRFALDAEHRALLTWTVFPVVVAGLVALIVMVRGEADRSRRAWLAAIVAAAALEMAFAAAYGIPDPAAYFLAPLMVALLAIPMAGARLGRRLPATLALATIVIPLALAPGWIGGALTERHRLEAVEVRIHRLWRAIPFDRGIVLWNDDHYTRLAIYQILGGERPGLDVENPSMLTWPAPRRAFLRRWGFDPLAGLELRDESALSLVPPNVARLSPVPVIDFAALAGAGLPR